MNNCDCPLLTIQPLSKIAVANVSVKIVQIDGKYIAGAVAQMTDYLEVLDMDTFDSRSDAENWSNNKVRELWEACGGHQMPKVKAG